MTSYEYAPVGIYSTPPWGRRTPTRKESGMNTAREVIDGVEGVEDDHIVRGLD
ncbi:hypothetical protein [Actinomycetospora straminea]|uniref:Uncharacterized protein n=1 Tax=Actinomycetospora straminea TaxID=663607 RepID=A0ABP9EPQ2_9PSEU|nr:hypothetical protein [Actinomycetospora straminea]MDD7935488.1 hypothetical protein [Actinomycetospora straminea]